MFSILISFFALVCLCAARPQEPPAVAAAAPGGTNSEPIQIVSQTEENNPDGSFQFSFETADGIKIEEKGYLKDGENASKIQVIEGTASYLDKDGNPIVLKFIADENGFQPQGDHIPKAPESQPAVQERAQSSALAQPAPAAAQPTGLAAAQPQPAEPAPTEPTS